MNHTNGSHNVYAKCALKPLDIESLLNWINSSSSLQVLSQLLCLRANRSGPIHRHRWMLRHHKQELYSVRYPIKIESSQICTGVTIGVWRVHWSAAIGIKRRKSFWKEPIGSSVSIRLLIFDFAKVNHSWESLRFQMKLKYRVCADAAELVSPVDWNGLSWASRRTDVQNIW